MVYFRRIISFVRLFLFIIIVPSFSVTFLNLPYPFDSSSQFAYLFSTNIQSLDCIFRTRLRLRFSSIYHMILLRKNKILKGWLTWKRIFPTSWPRWQCLSWAAILVCPRCSRTMTVAPSNLKALCSRYSALFSCLSSKIRLTLHMQSTILKEKPGCAFHPGIFYSLYRKRFRSFPSS